ncbi:hypothetical protein COLO4_18191 [Corchorus olitorius]|uniref:Serine aminopeptidase S33 domain-containing protein n=1 Tax=Corchorus olitorius TaxID=93759 RepID=A0A1R3JA27_9ROSI|nr:hypothetical protein COLO4_18191 [Corchorus olitorius]
MAQSDDHSAQNPGIEQQRVIIPNKQGEKLVGILHETGSKGIVVLCHGFRATKVEKEGISAFRFDFAGIGESEGSFEFGNTRRDVDDLHTVIQHFCGANRIVTAVLGHSKGGLVVLLYASKYHDINTVINVSSRYNLKKGMEGPFTKSFLGKDFMDRIKKDGFVDVKNQTGEFRVTLESLMDQLSINMHEECLKIPRECRVLTVHGSADEITPVEESFEFDKTIPNHKLHIVEGANHVYTSHKTELASVVLRIEQQRVIIPNKHGEKLVGLLHETGSKGIVVLCHGVGATKDHPIMVNLAVALEKEGISAFRFDFAGIGESEGSSGFGNIIQEVDDLHAVIQHFCGANRKVTAILGHSKGGLVVLLYASKYHDIHTVINVCSRYDFKKGLEGPFGKDFMDRFKKDGFIDVKNPTGEYRVTLESVMDLLSINMHEECLKIPRECRVLTIHGSADEITPVEDAFEFAKLLDCKKNKEMEILACKFQPFILNLSNYKARSNFLKFPHPQIHYNSSATTLTLRMAHSDHSAQNPGIEQQRVIIPNKHGEKLVGLLHETGSKEIVVLCHGFRSTKADQIMVNLAVALEKEGISAFRFDFAGNGESEGSFEFGNYLREADDLHAVIQHFCGANRTVSTILGHSKVINASGRYDLKKGIEERFGKDFMDRIKQDGFLDFKDKKGEYRVTLESLMDRLSINMHEECLKIPKECRVLTVHGSADEIIPVEDAFEFAKIIPNNELHIVRFILSANRISVPNLTTLRMAHSLSDQNPVNEQQRVIIPNKHGEKLVGLLHEHGSKEIVVLCHGFRSSKDYTTMRTLVAAFEKEGISVFRFDFAGNGESEGSFQYGNYYREADDLHAVIQHLSGENRVVIAILGHSKGGNVVLLYASKYQDIPMVVNVSGRYDLKRGIAERLGEDFMEKIKKDGYIDVKNKQGDVEYRVTEESLMDRLGTDMHEACLKIDKDCRLLTVHGSADVIVPVEDASSFAKIIPNHQLHILKRANHGYTLHQTKLASVVLNFIKDGLSAT